MFYVVTQPNGGCEVATVGEKKYVPVQTPAPVHGKGADTQALGQ